MKKVTKDDYIQSVYKVILYIERNYHEELTLEELSKIASFSKYHFHRIFKSIIGETVGEYVRTVRLQNSTRKLSTSNQNITQIALDIGYETNASFSKAFKERFGVTPKEFSKNLKSKQRTIMIEPKIIELEPIEVLYIRKVGDYTKVVGEAWESIMSFAYPQKIKFKKNLMGKDAQMFGIGHDDPSITPKNELRYDACISYDDKSVKPRGEIGVKTIEGGRYVKYLHKGAYEELKESYQKVMDWIIENNYTIANKPPFEKYLNRDPRRTKPENLKTEIYIPVI
jgi:AraC family transcriptional regulator